MKLNSIFSTVLFSRALIAAAAAAVLMVFSGAASAESWDDYEATRNYNDAVHYMNKGYAEIGKVVNKLDEDEENSATRHFNWAMKDFDKAVEYFAKAVLPPEDKDAIASLKKGLDALEKSSKAMEKGDVSTAQADYDTAQDYLAQASALLD
jgi:tetratricopeptide (TPR) repeat protein